MAVEFRLLGDIDVRVDGERRDVGHARQCCVLAALLVDVNQPVPVDQLLDRVWADRLPQRARNTLSGYLSRLRQTLSDVDGVLITRERAGYVLTADPATVDIHRFRTLTSLARAADDETALALFEQALGLWRGEAFAALDTPWLSTVRDGLDAERLAAELNRNDLALSRGRHAELLAELSARAADHPLDERLAGQLLLALYRCGRQADALERYELIRLRLSDELGTDPGPTLRRLHQKILTTDPGLDAMPVPQAAPEAATSSRPATPAATGHRSPPVVRVPHQLPALPRWFIGRTLEITELDATLPAADQAPVAAVSAISGTAGVGKTALAVHWAHRIADRFPDGQLYVDLRGYDPDRPVTAAAALARFLAALGVADADIPLGTDERAARYRTETAGRRMLMVLDNAATVEQVRPLLPGTGTCAVVVTSRDSLAGLVARDGAHRIDLDLLPATEACALLRGLIGPRAEADPDATSALAERCVRLPLALRVAAELAASRPTAPLTDLVAELADRQQRLDLLNADGDPRAAVTAVFSWSIQRLPPDAARAFRLLGTHPGPDFDTCAAAALTDTVLAPARHMLDALSRAHLVHPTTADRYGMHDLLRAYALHLAAEQESEAALRAAMDRLCDFYVGTAAAAMDRLHPAEDDRRPRTPRSSVHILEPADADAARSWLDAERAGLVALAAYTADHGRPAHTVRLSTTLLHYLDGGHFTDALTLHTHAHRAATRTGDLCGQARALLGLGSAHLRMGRYKPAAGHLSQALRLSQRVGDDSGQARVLLGLGLIDRRRGRYERAAVHLRQAVDASRRAGDRISEIYALLNLGIAEQRREHHRSAARHLLQALALAEQLGNRAAEGAALDIVGTVHTRLGESAQAAGYHRRALALYRETGQRDGEAMAHNGLGEATRAAGAAADALTHHTDALTVATDIGDPEQQARAHAGLGHSHRALGNTAQARHHYQHALSLYQQLHSPEADSIQARLEALDRPVRENFSRINGSLRGPTAPS